MTDVLTGAVETFETFEDTGTADAETPVAPLGLVDIVVVADEESDAVFVLYNDELALQLTLLLGTSNGMG